MLGLGLMAFVCLKLEQILAGKQESSDEDNRKAQTKMKGSVKEWLKVSKAFKLEANGVISLIGNVAGEEKPSDASCSKSMDPDA